jgi:ketosteroid isomerase-like protein
MLAGDKLEIEAFRSYSEEKCNRFFDDMKTNGTWAVPTLMPYKTIGLLNNAGFRNDSRMKYFGGEFRDWLIAKDDPRLKSWTSTDFELERELFKREESLVGELSRAGVPLLAGTDAGNPYCFPGFSLHEELALLVESGLTPLAALQAATRNAATFMNATNRYGSVRKGKLADLVLLDADPLEDIHNTTKISEVFLDGKEFDRAALDQILASAGNKEIRPPIITGRSMDDSSSNAEAELRAFMTELRTANIQGDVDTVANSITDDYIQTDINGYRQDKTTWLNEYFKPLADLIKAGKFHWDEYERTNLQFRFYGDCAVVTGELHAKGTGAKFGPPHTWVADPNASFSGILHFTHVYIKQNGKWMLAALHNQIPLPPANAAK